jgi:hypothetical protein
MGYKARIVKAVVSQFFVLGDTHTILHEDIDDIEKRERKG